MTMINSYDFDGVINMGKYDGLRPGPNDIIITGRSYEEKAETLALLKAKDIHNKVYFNSRPFDMKTRISSGRHKALTLYYLEEMGCRFGIHFDDDPIQIAEIKRLMPHINCVLIDHDLVEKENVRRNEYGETL